MLLLDVVDFFPELALYENNDEHFPHAAEGWIDIQKAKFIHKLLEFVHSFVFFTAGLLLSRYDDEVKILNIAYKFLWLFTPLRLEFTRLVPSEDLHTDFITSLPILSDSFEI